MPHDPKRLYAALLENGFKEFSGVPCSILDPLIIDAEASPEVHYLPASVEGEAVSVAAGAWLAGSSSVVLMQNSGLGNAINPIASLAVPYRIPMLLISSWRGEPGTQDAVHHAPMGRATQALFELFDVPVTVLDEDADLGRAVADASKHLDETLTPAALLVPRGVFEKGGRPEDAAPPMASAQRPVAAPSVATFGGGPLPNRTELLESFLPRAMDGATVSTTGYMSRELSAHLCGRFFPMQGSMGFAAAIALGITRVKTELPVFVLDGDGALIMRMGSLATVGAAQPTRLVHIVADNGTYASTGGQKTVSPGVDFARVAAHCGYGRVGVCEGRRGLDAAIDWARDGLGSGPSLLHVAIDTREAKDLERPKIGPPQIAANFRRYLMEGAA